MQQSLKFHYTKSNSSIFKISARLRLHSIGGWILIDIYTRTWGFGPAVPLRRPIKVRIRAHRRKTLRLTLGPSRLLGYFAYSGDSLA